MEIHPFSLFHSLFNRYVEQVSETLSLVKSIEDGLKRFKKKGTTARHTDTASMSDEDKIRTQMSLDVEAFQDEVSLLFGGVLPPRLAADLSALSKLVLSETGP